MIAVLLSLLLIAPPPPSCTGGGSGLPAYVVDGDPMTYLSYSALTEWGCWFDVSAGVNTVTVYARSDSGFLWFVRDGDGVVLAQGVASSSPNERVPYTYRLPSGAAYLELRGVPGNARLYDVEMDARSVGATPTSLTFVRVSDEVRAFLSSDVLRYSVSAVVAIMIAAAVISVIKRSLFGVSSAPTSRGDTVQRSYSPDVDRLGDWVWQSRKLRGED